MPTRSARAAILILAVLLPTSCGERQAPAPPANGTADPPAGNRPIASQPPQPKASSPYVFGYLGGMFGDLEGEAAAKAGGKGVVVVQVVPGGPAEKSGLRAGDLIVEAGGQPAGDKRSLGDRVRALGPGESLTLRVRREGASVELTLTLGERSIVKLVRQLQAGAAAYLSAQQKANGAWPHAAMELIKVEGNPSISYTGLSLQALAGLPEDLRGTNAAAIGKAVEYLRAHIDKDGGLRDPEESSAVIFRNFATALTVRALAALDRERHREAIGRMCEFLTARQVDDPEGFKEFDWQYGGWPYYESTRAFAFRTDIVAVAIVTRGLAAAGLDPAHPCWAKARRFLERSQNYEEEPQRRNAHHDGGFFFNPRSSKAGEDKTSRTQVQFRSYGSTTCDGLSAMLHAGADSKDPRVQAAFRWLQAQYTLKENPGFKPEAEVRFQEGIYYYYLYAFTDAMAALGQETIAAHDGRTVHWVVDLANQLERLQRPDGSWVNPLNIMAEDDPIIATGLALASLNAASRFLK